MSTICDFSAWLLNGKPLPLRWEVDLRTWQVFWTREVYRILETSPQEYTPTMETTHRFFTPVMTSVNMDRRPQPPV